MIIKNISDKVISVGSKVLMPDAMCDFEETWKEIPSVQKLVEMGFLQIEGLEVKSQKEEEPIIEDNDMEIVKSVEVTIEGDKPKRGRVKK